MGIPSVEGNKVGGVFPEGPGETDFFGEGVTEDSEVRRNEKE